MMPAKRVPIYQRLTASGAVREQRAGVTAALKAGDAVTNARVTWEVVTATLAGLTPRAGDRMTDTSGNAWIVAEVGTEAGGVYPLTCDKVEG